MTKDTRGGIDSKDHPMRRRASRFYCPVSISTGTSTGTSTCGACSMPLNSSSGVPSSVADWAGEGDRLAGADVRLRLFSLDLWSFSLNLRRLRAAVG